ncbi:MAG TPA: MliC family protein [Pseudomonadales bacterium]|nr:MliC family protein [Pseudomonadales bacterium]
MRTLITGVACIGAAWAYGATTAAPSAPPKSAPKPPEPLVDAMFKCGQTRADAMFEEGTMSLTIDANTYSLKAVPSASGAKYEGDSSKGKIVFWSKGHDASLKVGGQPEVKCTQVDDDEVDSDEVDD